MQDSFNFLKAAGSAVRSFSDGFKKTFIDVTPFDVITVLENTKIRRSQYTTEANVESIISKALSENFGKVHRQYSIGGFLPLKVDVDINDGQVGIEIKLAKNLDTACIERLFGQVLYYSRRTYKKNLIVLIVGTPKEHTTVIKEVSSICEEQGIFFHYLNVG